jgi:hypothetical protein
LQTMLITQVGIGTDIINLKQVFSEKKLSFFL